MTSPTISVVLPTLNEAQNVLEITQRLKTVFKTLGMQYEIIFVDDNSTDGTIENVHKLSQQDPGVKYLIMSRRFGDQPCLMAGIKYATGDAIVTMDSDLQHPPEDIIKMVKKWQEGFEIIIMKRNVEGHNSFFKKWTEIAFYKILNSLSPTPIIFRFAGFALLDRKAAKALNQYEENDPFLRGLISLIGFKKIEMFYEETSRTSGQSKYDIFSMMRLALTGLTSFSVLPLYFALYIGGATILFTILFSIYVLTSIFFLGQVGPSGWASTILVILFLGGIQLFCTGLLGVYLSKIFLQSKFRPNYIVAKAGGFDLSQD